MFVALHTPGGVPGTVASEWNPSWLTQPTNGGDCAGHRCWCCPSGGRNLRCDCQFSVVGSCLVLVWPQATPPPTTAGSWESKKRKKGGLLTERADTSRSRPPPLDRGAIPVAVGVVPSAHTGSDSGSGQHTSGGAGELCCSPEWSQLLRAITRARFAH